MANMNKIVYTAVVILCMISAVMCENDSSVQGSKKEFKNL